MSTLKLLISASLGLAIVFGRVGYVHAAPPWQEDSPITGTVQSVVIESNGETVLVTLLVDVEVQTVRVGLETASGLGLIVVDTTTGSPVVDESKIGTDVDILPSTIIDDETPIEEKKHPAGTKIADFFSGITDYETVMSSHSDGFGFGVIAQTVWITQSLGGDVTLFQTILDAKKSGDYSMVALPDGTIPQNWGQFRQAVLKDGDDKSLGDIMSGGDDQPGNSGNGNGKPQDPGNGNGKPEDPGNGNGKPEDPGNGNGKPEDPSNGNGKPENPPGQDKDKDKDKQNNGNGKDK